MNYTIPSLHTIVFIGLSLFLSACGGSSGGGNNDPQVDLVPNTFSFAAQTGVAVATEVDSVSVTITGITASTAVTITNGAYSIDGGDFSRDPGTINNDQSLVVRVTSAANTSSTVESTLTVGGVSADFVVTTLGGDTTPDAFTFERQTGAPIETAIDSDPVTITGIVDASPITVVNGSYSIDGGDFTSAPGLISNNQSVVLRLTSSSQFSTAAESSLTIGGISAAFGVTTNAPFFFPADNGETGRELWVSDGSETGTRLVRDINNSTLSSVGPFSRLQTTANGQHFFLASDGVNGIEFWTSDGTRAGTVMVKDINPGSGDAYSDEYLNEFSAVNGDKFYFRATNGVDGAEAWVSDGTDAGTFMLADINASGDSSARDFTAIGDTVYFAAFDGASWGIWKTDGTVSGTGLVKNTSTENDGSFVSDLFAVNDTLYFQNYGDLWKSDGTDAGTVMFTELGSALVNFGAVGDTLYFGTSYSLVQPGFWRTDGTEEGTVLLKNIFLDDVKQAGVIGNTIYFAAEEAASGYELWKSDGTSDGTVLVKDINPGVDDSDPFSFSVFNDRLYFTADDGVSGEELWTSDGTEIGTVMVKDINPGPASSLNGGILLVGETLYLIAQDDVNGNELWVSDGTEAGTRLLKDINEGPESSFTRDE